MTDDEHERRLVALLDLFHGEELEAIHAFEVHNPGMLRRITAALQLSSEWHGPIETPKTAANLELLAMNAMRLLAGIARLFASTTKDEETYQIAAEIAERDPRYSVVIQHAAQFMKPFGNDLGHPEFLPTWLKQSFARLEVAHKLAAALCLTDVPDDVEVKAPWEAWSLVIPTGLLPAQPDGRTIARIWCLGAQPVFAISADGRIGNSLQAAEAAAVTALVRGACLALSDPEKFRKESHAQKAHGASGKKRRGPPDLGQAKFLLSAPVKIDLREHLTHVLSGHKGASPTVQFLVRGHWRNQAHGPRLALRKVIWVEPFWKGPEDTRVLLRQHKIDPEGPLQP